jgi:hypothetical protein
MPTVKFTCQRGRTQIKDIPQAAGTAEAQTETISVNIDYTNMRKSDVLLQLQAVKARIVASRWPPQ